MESMLINEKLLLNTFGCIKNLVKIVGSLKENLKRIKFL